jgi:hypothetical protein
MQNPLCKYKNILGESGSTDGLRKYRIFGIALLDTTVVLFSAILIAWIFRLSYIKTIIAIFILGIVVHRAFCVRTAVDKLMSGRAD